MLAPPRTSGVHRLAVQKIFQDETEQAGGGNLRQHDEQIEHAHHHADFFLRQRRREHGVRHGEDARPRDADRRHGNQQLIFVGRQRHRRQPQRADREAENVHQLGAGVFRAPQQHEGKNETHGVIRGETKTRPRTGGFHFRRAGRGVKNIFRHGRRKINPHRKHPDPGEKLHQPQFPHPPGQLKDQREDVAQAERPVEFPRADVGQFRLRTADIPRC